MFYFYFQYDLIYPSGGRAIGRKITIEAKDGKDAMKKLRARIAHNPKYQVVNLYYFGREEIQPVPQSTIDDALSMLEDKFATKKEEQNVKRA